MKIPNIKKIHNLYIELIGLKIEEISDPNYIKKKAHYLIKNLKVKIIKE